MSRLDSSHLLFGQHVSSSGSHGGMGPSGKMASNGSSANAAYMTDNHNLSYPLSSAGPAQNVPDIESVLQVHRRKMLRRAANRKSAQLSRARKKAHMEDMKSENSRLQKLIDVLDSLPDVMLTITAAGRLTYISDRSLMIVRDLLGAVGEEEPSYLSQILSQESLQTVASIIDHLNSAGYPDSCLLMASQEVKFRHGQIGYIRCSKLNRTKELDESGDYGGESGGEGAPVPPPTAPAPQGPLTKKFRRVVQANIPDVDTALNGSTSNADNYSQDEFGDQQLAISFLVNAAASLTGIPINDYYSATSIEATTPSAVAAAAAIADTVSSCSNNNSETAADGSKRSSTRGANPKNSNQTPSPTTEHASSGVPHTQQQSASSAQNNYYHAGSTAATTTAATSTNNNNSNCNNNNNNNNCNGKRPKSNSLGALPISSEEDEYVCVIRLAEGVLLSRPSMEQAIIARMPGSPKATGGGLPGDMHVSSMADHVVETADDDSGKDLTGSGSGTSGSGTSGSGTSGSGPRSRESRTSSETSSHGSENDST